MFVRPVGRLARGTAPRTPEETKGIVMARTHEKAARFELRCSSAELAAWRYAAAGHGLTLAAYIRVGLNQRSALSRTKMVDPALIRQVAAIGNNLNQITHWCNTYKAKQDARPVEEGIARVHVALATLLAQQGDES